VRRLKSENAEVIPLVSEPGSLQDAAEALSYVNRLGSSWVVVDGYHFGASYQKQMKASGASLLFLDDNGHAGEYVADIVLNYNFHASERFYQNRLAHTELLLGTKYLLLRREFLKWKDRKHLSERKKGLRLLVTFGGSDLENLTCRAVRALDFVHSNPLEVEVVIGATYPHRSELEALVKKSHFPVSVKTQVTDFSEIMARSDLALSAGGVSCCELAFMGVPTLVIVAADNQRLAAQAIHEKGVGYSLGWWERVREAQIGEALNQLVQDEKGRARISAIQRQLVDGEGAARVVKAIQERIPQ